MNGNCHFIYGATVGSMVALNLDKVATILPHITNTPETATLFVLGGLVGGIFPDIDNPSSYMGKLSAPVSTIIGVINRKLGKTGANHRGILHDPLIYLIGVIISYIYLPSLIGFFIGCLSHLFLDMFNPKGIPFFIFRKVSLGNFDSGEIGSIVFTWICVILSLILGIMIKL
ncbi:MAG: metal-dependent hydrolase [Bacilli bacterium]|nr:metal-dependent hydrolase [Bacilli bacterium]MBQ8218772.1 metal-dependent hydrolase [Bacilli bacterium]